jgi:hypothetical protein
LHSAGATAWATWGVDAVSLRTGTGHNDLLIVEAAM